MYVALAFLRLVVDCNEVGVSVDECVWVSEVYACVDKGMQQV